MSAPLRPIPLLAVWHSDPWFYPSGTLASFPSSPLSTVSTCCSSSEGCPGLPAARARLPPSARDLHCVRSRNRNFASKYETPPRCSREQSVLEEIYTKRKSEGHRHRASYRLLPPVFRLMKQWTVEIVIFASFFEETVCMCVCGRVCVCVWFFFFFVRETTTCAHARHTCTSLHWLDQLSPREASIRMPLWSAELPPVSDTAFYWYSNHSQEPSLCLVICNPLRWRTNSTITSDRTV